MILHDRNSQEKSPPWVLLRGRKAFYSILAILSSVTIVYISKRVMHGNFEYRAPNFRTVRTRLQNQSSTHSTVDMPCIEPHCAIECVMMNETNDENGILQSASLGKTELQHLMIDMGRDSTVQELINTVPPPKTCMLPSTLISDGTKNVRSTVDFYPILFGFVENYLPKTSQRHVWIDKGVVAVDRICLPKKWKDFSDLIPGKLETYKFGFADELEYRRAYSAAYFAVTIKKGGWDCNRHYEIISAGTIPFFDRLADAGNYTLSILPKPLLYQAQHIPGVNRERLSIDHKSFDIDQYNLLLHRLLYYAKHRLTTEKVVEYVLQVMKYSRNSSQKHSVLYLSHDKCDYMKDLLLHGFTNVFQGDLHVFEPPKYLYEYPTSKMWTHEETKNYYGQRLYGFGYGYKLSLKQFAHLYERDIKELSSQTMVEKNIIARKYSLIVFGSILRQNGLFPLTKKYYKPSEIVLVDGEDEQRDTRRSQFARYGTYFLREIPEKCDLFT